MKIALVDDEPIYLDKMERLCQDFALQNQCLIETVPFTSGETFLKSLKQDSFPLVFMDIYMSGMDGITTALKMREHDSRCLLVFLTSSKEFMPDAFSCHAFEYITKPFSEKRVAAVLQDALKVLPPALKYIVITSSRKTIPVFLHDIISAVTDAHYINFSLMNGTSLRSRMTMPEFLRLTENDPRFILVNKGIALNADHILDFENNCCILENGTTFPIRVRNCQKVEQSIQNYHFEKIRSHQRYG